MKTQINLIFWLFYLLSIIIVVCLNVWVGDISAFLRWKQEIIQLVSDFFMAYITGFTFYLVVNGLQEKRNRKNTYQVIANTINRIIQERENLFADIFEKPHLPKNRHPREKYDFTKLYQLDDINFFKEHLNRYDFLAERKITYGEVLKFSLDVINDCCEKLFSFMFVLDTEIVNIIDTIGNHSLNWTASSLVATHEIAKGRNHNKKAVEAILNQMVDYFDQIEKLKEFQKKHILPYLDLKRK